MDNRELDERQVNNAVSESHLENLQYKLARCSKKYSREHTKQIIEEEMPGMRKEIHKGWTNNCYLDSARRLGVKSLEEHWEFIMVLKRDVPKGEVCINWRFVCEIKHKPSKDAHVKTDAYIGNRRILDAVLRKAISRINRRKCICPISTFTKFKSFPYPPYRIDSGTSGAWIPQEHF